MSFRIDKQTLDELNLLGKFRHGSVYHLFNQVKTRGGEQLLENMFQHLLADEAAINERSSIFRFFQQSKLAFPFDVQQVSLMREYLDTGTGTNALVAIADTLVKKVLSSLARDQRYKKNIQGLQATILTLQRCYAVVDMIPSHNSPFSG